MKKLTLSSLLKLAVCCSILLTNQGFAADKIESQERQPAGARALSVQEHVAIQENRLNLEKERGNESLDISSVRKIEFNIEKERKEADQEKDDDIVKKEFVKKDLYFTTHEGVYHSTIAVSLNGDTVELEDGSCWSVSYWDRGLVLNWFTTDQIIVTQNLTWFSSYYYQLVNLQTGHKVNVNLAVKPFYNGYYTHWVTAVDPVMNEVYLDDGSVWAMDVYDRNIVLTWAVNDTVIIGCNECHNPSCPVNILINAETLEYARGTCLN